MRMSEVDAGVGDGANVGNVMCTLDVDCAEDHIGVTDADDGLDELTMSEDSLDGHDGAEREEE